MPLFSRRPQNAHGSKQASHVHPFRISGGGAKPSAGGWRRSNSHFDSWSTCLACAILEGTQLRSAHTGSCARVSGSGTPHGLSLKGTARLVPQTLKLSASAKTRRCFIFITEDVVKGDGTAHAETDAPGL